MKQSIRELAYSDGVSVPVREAMLAMENQLKEAHQRNAHMLAALRRAVLALAFAAEYFPSMRDVYNAVSDAIAKATGGQP